jgi:hypothetical protein
MPGRTAREAAMVLVGVYGRSTPRRIRQRIVELEAAEELGGAQRWREMLPEVAAMLASLKNSGAA